ncbi:MAG: hypothetical protein GY697_10555 [Desulfobacterales bacterium]|nr:hypothetical protein [Desulfobacterales bacterium]
MPDYIIGLSGSQEDSTVVLLDVAGNEPELMLSEDRHSGKNHFFGFPWVSMEKTIEQAGRENIVMVAYGRDKTCFRHPAVDYFAPLLDAEDDRVVRSGLNRLFDRLDTSYPDSAFLGARLDDLLRGVGVDPQVRLHLQKRIAYLATKYINELFTEAQIRRLLPNVPITGFNHHATHAAAYYSCPFDNSAVITWDGRGEFDTVVLWEGRGGELQRIAEIRHPWSLGMFYEIIADDLGFGRAPGPGKLMGLASYGDDRFEERFTDLIQLPAGEFRFSFNERYLECSQNERLRITPALREIIGPSRRRSETITARHQAVARATQDLLTRAAGHLVNVARERLGTRRFVFAGGVALNCVMNEALRVRCGIEPFILPVCADHGVSLGAAILARQQLTGQTGRTAFTGAYGLRTHPDEVAAHLDRTGFNYRRATPEDVAGRLRENAIIGVVNGRYELGPRALCFRSILADPTRADNWKKINNCIKFREDFRPFAPVMLSEDARRLWGDRSAYAPSPYMLLAPVFRPEARDRIPAVVHVDFSSRLQTVSKDMNPFIHSVLNAFKALSGIGCLLNTSLNMSGESIIVDYRDMLAFLAVSGLDAAYIEGFLIEKGDNQQVMEAAADQFADRQAYIDHRWRAYRNYLRANDYPLQSSGFTEVYKRLFQAPVPDELPLPVKAQPPDHPRRMMP